MSSPIPYVRINSPRAPCNLPGTFTATGQYALVNAVSGYLNDGNTGQIAGQTTVFAGGYWEISFAGVPNGTYTLRVNSNLSSAWDEEGPPIDIP